MIRIAVVEDDPLCQAQLMNGRDTENRIISLRSKRGLTWAAAYGILYVVSFR